MSLQIAYSALMSLGTITTRLCTTSANLGGQGAAAERRVMPDSADSIATFAAEMSEFLKTSELTGTRPFVRSFVKEIEVRPGKAAIVYSIPTP